MTTIKGGRPTRKRDRRQPPHSTFESVGALLRSARAEQGIELAEIRDRTGVSRELLEALEAGEPGRISDSSSAISAVRRMADLLGLNTNELTVMFVRAWVEAKTSSDVPLLLEWPPVLPPASGTYREPAGTGVVELASRQLARSVTELERRPGRAVGHLARYSGSPAHLTGFTQTAQVPAVAWRPDPRTSVLPAIPMKAPQSPPGTPGGGRRRAPFALRALVWLVLALLVVAGAGLVTAHYRPSWLKKLHLLRTGSTHVTVGSSISPSSAVPAVRTVSSSGATANVVVHARNYEVRVAAFNRVWIQATAPSSYTEIFSGTLAPGQSQTIDPVNGQLTLELAATSAVVVVDVGGKILPGWFFTPTAVPFYLNFVYG
jgi:transcriptional regulator with XRE-family HTH domain